MSGGLFVWRQISSIRSARSRFHRNAVARASVATEEASSNRKKDVR